LIFERYLNGARESSYANIKSASKTILSALVGIAIDRGLIPGIDTPVAAYFPELLEHDPDERKRRITIESLLTMRSGLQSTSSRNYGAWVHSPHWVRYVLSRRMLSPPDFQMEYSTGNSHLLSAILTKVSGTSTWEFANSVLAEPLGIQLARWPQDPQGIYFGGNDMEMMPRQMVLFGELYLNRGRAGDKQVVPAGWINASFLPRTRSRRSDRLYGYGWWIRDLAGFRSYYAWGFGGQFIFVIPDLELVVVATSSTSTGRDRRGHLGDVYDLVEEQIIPAVAPAEISL
jgi:CubicO group peptidase (beta-lactamase class C family)